MLFDAEVANGHAPQQLSVSVLRQERLAQQLLQVEQAVVVQTRLDVKRVLIVADYLQARLPLVQLLRFWRNVVRRSQPAGISCAASAHDR